MPDLAELFPAPWRVEEYDARVFVLAANGAKVVEVQPSIIGGGVVKRVVKLALAQAIVDGSNAPLS